MSHNLATICISVLAILVVSKAIIGAVDSTDAMQKLCTASGPLFIVILIVMLLSMEGLPLAKGAGFYYFFELLTLTHVTSTSFAWLVRLLTMKSYYLSVFGVFVHA